jgi:hypothetical protein
MPSIEEAIEEAHACGYRVNNLLEMADGRWRRLVIRGAREAGQIP